MNKIVSRCAVALISVLVGVNSLALEADQIRGELLDVDQDMRFVEVRVLEAGDAVSTRVGATEIYEIDDATEIEFDLDRPRTLLRMQHLDGFDDLAVGQEVVMDFKMLDERRVATRFKPERQTVERDVQAEAPLGESQNVNSSERMIAANDSPARTRLPETASSVYGVGLLGIGFGVVALLLRRRRNRS